MYPTMYPTMSKTLLKTQEEHSHFNMLNYNPVRWFDASDTSTITPTSGAFVIKDKSGNGNDGTQTIVGQEPTSGVNTINGRNVLIFDGSDDRLAVDGISGWRYLALVLKGDSVNTTQGLGSSGGTTNILGILQNGSAVTEVWRNFTVDGLWADGAVASDASRGDAFSAIVTDATRLILLDLSAGQTNLTTFLYAGAGFAFDGDMAEAVWLPDIDKKYINTIMFSLADKWAGTWDTIA